MATSMEAQLKLFKSKHKTDAFLPGKTITKPSLLYDPRVAADFDIHQIYDLSLSGLELLIVTEKRFIKYKNDLFDPKSRDMDRELMNDKENERINTTISSYLRLLSGFLQSPSAIKTLEYLVRRYKVHVYNSEDLILCALPYHDTHDFVRMVQLIDFGNTQWKFLDGVKKTGAPPPRKVIVQQCTCDMGVLETICKYASPTKNYQPSKPVISFSTAVVVEVLGSLPTIDNDIVQRIIPFLDSGLKFACKGSSDLKAGMLMILGLLAKRAALSVRLVGLWVRSLAELVQADMQVSHDTQWVELTIMALANMVQLQSVICFHKKTVDILKGIRELPKILSQLTMRFNIDRLVVLLLESFIEFSSSDGCCRLAVASIVETVPIEGLVKSVVFRLFSSCLSLWQKAEASECLEFGGWAKEVLFSLDKKYPHELRAGVHAFLDDEKMLLKFKDGKSIIEGLCKILDGNVKSAVASSDTMTWFALESPMADFRRAALLNLDLSILNGDAPSPRLVNVQDTVSRCLTDADLSVVQAALSLDKLPGLVDSASLLSKLKELLQRCTLILWSSASKDHSLAAKVVTLCLKHLVSISIDENDLIGEIAMLIFPLLLVFRKTKKVNLKAQELAKSIKWPLYNDLVSVPDLKKDLNKKAGKERYSAVNMSIVHSLATMFSSDAEKFMPWLFKCCSESELSKTLFYMVLMESSVMQTNTSSQLFESCFAFLKQEWRSLELAGDFSYGQEFNIKILDADDIYLLDEFDENSMKNLNAKLLVFVFWRLIKVYSSMIPADVNVYDDGEWISFLRDLYVFFAECNSKHLFKEHRYYLVQNGRFSPVHFLSTFVSVEEYSFQVQVESLHSLSMLCSQADETLSSQLFAGAPLILVPLSSDVQDVRTAAMVYAEQLGSLISRVKSGGKKNGNIDSWIFFLDELLSLLIQQKKMILSDRDFLPSLLVSILSSSSQSLLVPKDIGQRFEKSTTEGILTFLLGSAMKFPGHAKLKVLSLLKGLGGAIVRVSDVHSLLCELLQRRRSYHLLLDRSYPELSNVDVDILCLLIEICSMPTSRDIPTLEDHLLPALWIDDMMSSDAAVIRPCVTFLKNLDENLYSSLSAEMKLSLFQRLVLLYHDADIDVQNATREALLRLDISCSIASQILDSILASEIDTDGLSERKAKKSKKHDSATFLRGKDVQHVLSSLLDVLLLKKDMANRVLLLKPLFKLLERVFSDQWVTSVPATLCYIQQTLLLILEDIIASLLTDGSSSGAVFDKFDAGLLVNCARSTTDFTTCNHVYSLFAAISKVATDTVLLHVPDILAVLGKSTVGNDDSHSKHVFEEFISTVVPFWISKMDGGVVKLLQIFVEVMPDIPQHRRLSIVLHLLKTLGQSNSLGSLLILLFRALVSKQNESADFMSGLAQTEWEFNFAEQICEQYTSAIWLPSVVSMLKQILNVPVNNELFLILLLAMKFIMGKLQDPEFVFQLQSLEDMDTIQATLGELMEQAVLCWQLVDLNRKNKSLPSSLKQYLKEVVHSVVMKITKGMLPSTFFQGVSNMLTLADKSARKKALQVLCETMKDSSTINSKRGKVASVRLLGSWSNLSGSDLESFSAVCLEILQLLDSSDNGIKSPERLAAISALEVLANRFPSHHTIFSRCLSSVVRNIISDDPLVVAASLRTSGTLISVLGARALPELPQIMKSIFKITRDSTSDDHVLLSIVGTLEALVDNLGSFLSPYLGDIVDLLVLNPDCVSEANIKLKSRADRVKKLLSEKVPVRLALPALQNVYEKAVGLGDQCVCAIFELVKNFVSNMDKPSVAGYHTNIFDFCMVALDLRSQHRASLENINAVEKSVIDAVVSLSMKMTESMFKPLFIRSIEWVESKMEVDNGAGRNISRAVSFYGLVNKLAENHRSLFVPYFKYLLESSIKHLTDVDGHLRKKKKAKVQKSDGENTDSNELTLLEYWHLRALVLSSLHKCFLYDIGSLKFMYSTKFHLLLKPIVSQLVIAPPASLGDNQNLPSAEEVDDILVSCLGQLAITAGSDLLWKPLNHEVLMQTRSEMMRSRLLGLRIVKYLVENLKEEFLVLLAETIPFLAELLEDVELPVKTLAQEILKELESMSGENLRDYF